MKVLIRKNYDGNNPTQMIVGRYYDITKRGGDRYLLYSGQFLQRDRRNENLYHFHNVTRYYLSPNNLDISNSDINSFLSTEYNFSFIG